MIVERCPLLEELDLTANHVTNNGGGDLISDAGP